MAYEYKYQWNQKKVTNCVSPFIAPPIWWTHVTVAFNGSSTTTPQRLIRCTFSLTCGNPFNFSAIIIVRDAATSIIVLYLKVIFMTPDTVEQRGRFK
jgi:hypothetical protein